MKSNLRAARPPPKPLLIYDGDCDFCKYWAARWRKITGVTVDFLPLQDPQIAAQFPEIPRQKLEAAVHLVETDGAIFSGAEAALRSRAKNSNHQMLLKCYERSRIFAAAAEFIYRLIARHRSFFSWLWRTHP